MSNVICYSCGYFKKNEELRQDNDELRLQLKIAMSALKKYGDRDRWFNTYRQNSPDECPLVCKNIFKENGYKLAERTIKQIKARIRK
jgi:hypothetical protein